MKLYEQIVNKKESISVIGLGYVGLSLAVKFAKVINVIGFDIDNNKIEKYNNGIDLTKQVKEEEFKNTSIQFTSDKSQLKNARFHIIAVPTPVYKNDIPNLEHVVEASKYIGQNLRTGSIVVYESTVFPGVTEEICIPILENYSGLKCGIDFKVGYSPERISPGDSINTLESIVKIVSGIDDETLDIIAKVYELIIEAGVYRANSIKIAEATKIVENVQRDMNIAFINEISIILNKLNIDTKSVFDAASTKWNALNFMPGLVGGHCIGVDTYYLTYISKKFGYNPELILEGRKINNYMAEYISENVIKSLLDSGKSIKGSNIAIFGFSYKENCIDIRNTKVMDLIIQLTGKGINVKVVDPVVNSEEVSDKYGIKIYDKNEITNMDVIIFTVSHNQFTEYSLSEIKEMYYSNSPLLLVDINRIYDKKQAQSWGFNYWSL